MEHHSGESCSALRWVSEAPCSGCVLLCRLSAVAAVRHASWVLSGWCGVPPVLCTDCLEQCLGLHLCINCLGLYLCTNCLGLHLCINCLGLLWTATLHELLGAAWGCTSASAA